MKKKHIKTTIKDYINDKELLKESRTLYNEFICYHSSDEIITNFSNENDTHYRNPSTRMEALYFSDIPQNSFGKILYKVKIVSKYPLYYDLKNSYYDSLGIQEVFNEFLQGNESYLLNDLLDYGGLDFNEANYFIKKHQKVDLIIIEGVNYAKHGIEYIVPSQSYYKVNKSASINIISSDIKKEPENIIHFDRNYTVKVYYVVLVSNNKTAYLDNNYMLSVNKNNAKIYYDEDLAKQDMKKYSIKDMENYYRIISDTISLK